jgi:hypothetical protein
VSIGIRPSPGQDPRGGYRRVAELLDLH